MLRRLRGPATRRNRRAPTGPASRTCYRTQKTMLLNLLLPLLSSDGAHAAGNPPTELILVSLLLLVFWGIYRITAKKSG